MPLPPAIDDWLPGLRCPCCGGEFAPLDLPAGGALACRRRRWPVADGILVLREGPATDRALEALDTGDGEEAAAILAGADLRGRADRVRERLASLLLRRPPGRGSAAARVRRRLRESARGGFPSAVRALFGQPPWPAPAFADYLLRRRSDPTFVAAEVLAALVGPGRGAVLDLGCGTGHLLVSLAALGASRLAGVDALFPVLLLARRHLVPDAFLCCLDPGAPLPFAEGTFSRVHVVDALFDFPSLPAAVREVRRVLAPDGIAVLSHLHNRRRPHLYAGRSPLAPEEWLDLLAPLGGRLLDEREVVRVAVAGGELVPGSDPAELAAAPDLSALGGAAPATLPVDGPVLPPAVGPWRLSPEYAVRAGKGDRVRIERVGPPFISEEEAGPFPGILPPGAEAPAEALERLDGAELPAAAMPLAAARVVVPVPPGLDPATAPEGTPPVPPPRPRREGVPRLVRDLRSAVRGAGLAGRLAETARRRLPRGGLVILAGHRVTRDRAPDPLDLAIPRRVLEAHLELLARAGSFVDLEEGLARLDAGDLPPGLAFALTFDDGTEDLLREGIPVARERGVAVAVFACGPGAAPWGRFRWDVLGAGGRAAPPSAFRTAGARVGYHGARHRRVETLAGEDLAREVARPDWADLPIFAWPFGATGGVPGEVARVVRQAGYLAALSMRPGIVLPGGDPWHLPRVALHDAPPDGLLRRLLVLTSGLDPQRTGR